MAEQSHLALEGVHLSRGGREVLHAVTVGFPRGAVTAVVGPSGSGKSSLLRCLNRLDQPEAGRVLLDGEDITRLAPTDLRCRVGMILQTPTVFEGTVESNLAYGMEQVGREHLIRCLEAADLPASYLDRASTALSVGEAQRVCIARALVRRPEALLLDEPTSALDRDAAGQIEALIGSLQARGLTMVLVTHDLGQARRVAALAVLLVDGAVAAEGTPDRVEAAWPDRDGSKGVAG